MIGIVEGWARFAAHLNTWSKADRSSAWGGFHPALEEPGPCRVRGPYKPIWHHSKKRTEEKNIGKEGSCTLSHSWVEVEAHPAAVLEEPGAVRLSHSGEMFLGASEPASHLHWSGTFSGPQTPSPEGKEHQSPWGWTGDDSFPKQFVGIVGLELGVSPQASPASLTGES